MIMDPSLAEFRPPGKPAPPRFSGRYLAYALIPFVLLGYDTLILATSTVPGCAKIGEAVQLLTINAAVTLLTLLACCVDLACGHRSGWLSLGLVINIAWVAIFFAFPGW